MEYLKGVLVIFAGFIILGVGQVYAENDWIALSNIKMIEGQDDPGTFSYCEFTSAVILEDASLINGKSNAIAEDETCTVIVDPDVNYCVIQIHDPGAGDMSAVNTTVSEFCEGLSICSNYDNQLAQYEFSILTKNCDDNEEEKQRILRHHLNSN